jgi:Uncharacterized conserved protein
MNSKISPILYILFGVFGAVASNSNAYDLKSHTWTSDPTMRVATISFPSGSIWRDDLETGVGRWNGINGMWLEFDLTYSNYNSFNTPCDNTSGDGENNVAFVSSAAVDGNWGLHCSDYDGSERLESDIMFNADISWNTGIQDERVRKTDKPTFLKVVVHEFGHSVGLNHFDTEHAVMSQGYDGHLWWGGSETYRHHPMADDIQGSRVLYSHSNGEIDVTATNFEMSGATSTALWRNNSTITNVSAGNSVNVEYSVANIGKSSASFSLGVYLSTNDYISTSDTYLGGFGYVLPAHYIWDRDKTFTIPSNVAPGTYYIGVVVDTDNSLTENRESNNRLVFPGKWNVN